MTTRVKTFITSLNDKKGKRIGDIQVEVVMKFRKDLSLQSWDINDVTPVSPLTGIQLCNWCYERESLAEYLTGAVESVAEGVSEDLQDEQDAAQRDRENMNETYRTLNSQFV